LESYRAKDLEILIHECEDGREVNVDESISSHDAIVGLGLEE
jgi:hypothetical protein